MESQTQYALEFAGKVYTYFKDYFQIAEVVPKAGDCLGVASLDPDSTNVDDASLTSPNKQTITFPTIIAIVRRKLCIRYCCDMCNVL